MCSLTFTYDEKGNMVKIKRHATSEDSTRDLINLEWDASGKLVSANSVDGDGEKKNYTFTYDEQGRMISADRITDWNTQTYNYTYNEKGQLQQINDNHVRTYDADGKLIKVVYQSKISWVGNGMGDVEVNFTYDDQGRPATVSYSEGYFSLKNGHTLDFSKVEFQYVYGDYCTYVPAK
jgi:YD repeat-containing protein